MEDIGDKLNEVQVLERAIKERREIKCFYSFDDYTKELLLKPLKIANYEGFWYLVALDGRNDLLKKYYLKNMKSITVLETVFESEAKLDDLLDNSISIWFDHTVAPYKVTLNISKEISKYFQRKSISKTQKIESLYEDGSMDVSVEITNDMEIIPVVKYWLPHIKVLEPQSVKEVIQKDLEYYLNE